MDQITMLIKQIINGIQVGSIYALVALGYTMVYGIVKLINFAHGDFIMVGGYICLVMVPILQANSLPTILSVVIAVILCAALGVATEKIAYKPLRNAPKISALITAIGVSLFLENAFMLVFTPNPKPFTKILPTQTFTIGNDFKISFTTIVTIFLSVALMIVLQLFIKKTKIGRAMRAVSEDSAAAQLMGVNVNNTISTTFAIGAGLAAVASLLYCSAYPLVEPLMGSMLGLKAFIAAVFGGIGIIPGAMLGGMLMGLIESLTKAYISTQMADAVVFGILIVVLLVKPSGIFGKNIKEKV